MLPSSARNMSGQPYTPQRRVASLSGATKSTFRSPSFTSTAAACFASFRRIRTARIAFRGGAPGFSIQFCRS